MQTISVSRILFSIRLVLHPASIFHNVININDIQLISKLVYDYKLLLGNLKIQKKNKKNEKL